MTCTRSARRVSRALASAIALTCVPLWATEPAGVKLLRPGSLDGWEYATTAPANWTIKGGQLTGSSNSTPLLSGWTVGDFELRFEWSATSSASWTLGLPDVPSGAGLQITLREGEGCGAIRDGERTSGGTRIGPTSGDSMHTAAVRRGGGTLSVIVDGRVTGEVSVDRNRRFGLALSVAGGEASLRDLRLEEPRGNPLFNGKDLTGWSPDPKGEWEAQNGDLVPTTSRGNTYLRTDKEYGNFTFSFEYKIIPGGNSGVAIRTAKQGWPSGDGMELQILDRPGEVKDSSMAIYGNLPPLDRADKSDEWNRVVVKADGRMISAWVNGELVQQVNTAQLSELKHRHLKGWIGVQNHGSKVRFRELYALEAPDGLGLDAWYRSHSEPGAAIVLDRVMNSERLSRSDAVSSGVISKHVPKGGEHVLAELNGPGALVGTWSSFPSGRLAFFFDDESEPRIECPTEHLADHVPSVEHQDQPVLTCLSYAKSLKIVLTDPLEATYRLDYVSFPLSVPVESYSIKRTGVPRGMLQAISYRHQGLNGGRLREAEIYERVASEPRTIEPLTTVQLAELKGTGIVNWLRLHADRSALSNNDLWIEVTIDGESVPAIAAPARFLFPALAVGAEDAKQFNSMVMTRRDGFASLLAMPYGSGLAVSVRNRGSKPVEKVGISMSVDTATDANRADYAGRMRLRGVFQPAGTGDIARCSGAGRWVSLVCARPEGACGVRALVIDGQTRDGWAMTDLDPFFGRPDDANNYFRALSGCRAGLAWRYLMLAPVNFEHSLVLESNPDDKVGDRLALFYLKK
jgi:hypothetical protein